MDDIIIPEEELKIDSCSSISHDDTDSAELQRSSTQVEASPKGRFLRYDEKLGEGAFKAVFKGYDTETGREIAWNRILGGRITKGKHHILI